MIPRSLLSLSLLFVSVTFVCAEPPSFRSLFGRAPKADADDSKVYELSEEDGPFMILASTQVGEGARERANQLAIEIRRDLGLAAFIYNEKFDFTGTLAYDHNTSKRVRYANRYEYEAYAVLVGEYDRIDHPDVERDLNRIKSAKPNVLVDPKSQAAELNAKTPVTTVKAIAASLTRKSSGDKDAGPMATAFVTRNPMLPEEYFEAPVVDSFVSQLNEQFDEFNLLESDGKFTVVVKTFQGVSTLIGASKSKEVQPSGARMDKMAMDASKMAQELRKKGVEAYQFHDRQKSLVTVGSFDSLGRQLPNGQFEYDPQIRAVMKEYSALNVDPALARQVPPGTKGYASKNVGLIPFDVEPTPIAVPKKTKRSLYGAAFGLR
ncbi:hypothetical protein Pla22_21300 [Rubripirellula amarantea]|uniref:Uncharacterized protein n=1 Tax=Rubripirellula amarantea TaxID=2527999 RepID=A0A5C5WWX6_9BACT|nr:hypothetical protein [Rubripirellula amarantea]TWT54483.1 hypothetical protein Pla22_21300 [Rubripirellula amarantea]